MRAWKTKELQAIAGWDQYEAREKPKDFTISCIAANEIFELEQLKKLQAEQFREYITNFIDQQSRQLPAYDLQSLTLLRLQTATLIGTAIKNYNQEGLAKNLECLHNSITKYECSFD